MGLQTGDLHHITGVIGAEGGYFDEKMAPRKFKNTVYH
jgi:hypothetical protein